MKTTTMTDKQRRGPGGDLPPTAGIYSRAFVTPRPQPSQFPTASAYLAARDAWKKDYPNLHTFEEQAAHLVWLGAQLAKGGAS